MRWNFNLHVNSLFSRVKNTRSKPLRLSKRPKWRYSEVWPYSYRDWESAQHSKLYSSWCNHTLKTPILHKLINALIDCLPEKPSMIQGCLYANWSLKQTQIYWYQPLDITYKNTFRMASWGTTSFNWSTCCKTVQMG